MQDAVDMTAMAYIEMFENIARVLANLGQLFKVTGISSLSTLTTESAVREMI